MSKKHILIVDDEYELCELLSKKFTRAGYRAYIAGNGREALDIVGSNKIDLIITDVVMPVMDGVDFYRELRKSLLTSHIPVIVLSAKGSLENSFRLLGVKDFLSKPFDSDELVKRVEEILSTSRNTSKGKVIVSGPTEIALQMSKQLDDNGFYVDIAHDMAECCAKVLTIVPDILLIDILERHISAREIIRALKCFSKLRQMKILTYTQFSPDTLTDVETVDQLKESKNACLEAGADKYIGRYTSVSFVDSIREQL